MSPLFRQFYTICFNAPCPHNMNDDFKGHLIKLTWTCGIPVPWNSLTICSNVLTAYHKPAKSQAVKTTCFIQRKNNQTNDLSCSTKYNCLILLFGFAKHEPFNFLSKQIKGPFIALVICAQFNLLLVRQSIISNSKSNSNFYINFKRR